MKNHATIKDLKAFIKDMPDDTKIELVTSYFDGDEMSIRYEFVTNLKQAINFEKRHNSPSVIKFG